MTKIAVMLAAATISYSSVPVFAQQTASAQTSASVSATGQAGNTHMSQTSDINASASANRNGAMATGNAQSSDRATMNPVNGELLGKLDSKTAKPGDKVAVKTTQAFRTAEGVLVPKGSRLVGHVTEVQAHGSGNQDSRLGIQFDRAELKNGESFMVQSTIESVAPPANAVAAASMDSSADMGVIGGGGARAMGGGHAGGGLLGGGGSALSSTTAGVGSGLGHTVGAAGSLTSGTGASVGNGLSGAAGATGGLAAHATSVPGVMLAGAATGSASGVLSASKHNVHLDSGTQMTLGIAGAAGR